MADTQSQTDQSPSVNDLRFRRMVIVFTALSLAAAYGWLAGFVRQPDGDLSFQWRWLIIVWVLIGIVSPIYFWRKIWPPENHPASTRKDKVKGSIALLLPGVWWMIFPLLSLSGQHGYAVIEGLIPVVLVLSYGAFMITHLVKGFEKEDEFELNSEKAALDDNENDLEK